MAYSQTLANFIPEIWSKSLLKNWDDVFHMRKLVNTEYEGEIKDYGDTVHVPYLGNVTVNDYDNTVSPPITYENIGANTDTLTIDQRKYWAFKVEDLEQAQSNVKGLRDKYTKRAAVSMKDTVETWLLGANFYGAATNTLVYQTTGGVDGGPITAADIYSMLVKAKRKMRKANTWVENEMWLVIPPEIEELILTSPELTHATERSDELIRNGLLGKLAGWKLYVSNNLSGSGTDADPFHLVGGNRDFIHFAENFVKTRALELENEFAVGVSGLLVYGAKVFTPNAGCGIHITCEIG